MPPLSLLPRGLRILSGALPIDVAGDLHLENNGCPVFLVKNERTVDTVFNECLSVKNYLSTAKV